MAIITVDVVIQMFTDTLGMYCDEHSDFLEMGGDSMMIQRIVHLLNNEFNYNMKLDTIEEKIERLTPRHLYDLYILQK